MDRVLVRKLIGSNHVSLDGEVGSNECAFPYLYEGHHAYAKELHFGADMSLLVRKTYGARSTNRGDRNTSSSASRPSSVGALAGLDRCRAGPFWLHASVVGGPTLALSATCTSCAHQRLELLEAGVDHRVGFVSSSALSANISKSACAFPEISRASLCFFKSPSSRSIFLVALTRATASLDCWFFACGPSRRDKTAASRTPAPFDDVAGIQTFSTEQRALVTVAGTSVVLLDGLQLVLGGERPSPRLVGQGGDLIGDHLIMGALHRQGWHCHCWLPGPVSPLRDGDYVRCLRPC
jgi:hypothetical protein